MAGIREKPKIEIEEYEEIVGNWDQALLREGATDVRVVSVQEPTSNEQFDSMTHTERLALRPTEGSFDGEVNESYMVVIKPGRFFGFKVFLFFYFLFFSF